MNARASAWMRVLHQSPPLPLMLTWQLHPSGDTHSTNSAGAIEAIMSSSMLLANSHQQHMGLGSFDPIWQPGETVH